MASSLPRNTSCCATEDTTSVVNYGGVMQGHGAPVNPPANLEIAWLYTDLDAGVVYTWNIESQSWF